MFLNFPDPTGWLEELICFADLAISACSLPCPFVAIPDSDEPVSSSLLIRRRAPEAPFPLVWLGLAWLPC